MRKLISLLLTSGFFFLMQSVSAETVVVKQTELSHVTRQIQSLKKIIVNNQAHSATLQQQLKTAELMIGKLSEQITHLTRELVVQQKILDKLAVTQQETQLKLKIQDDALAHQLRAAW